MYHVIARRPVSLLPATLLAVVALIFTLIPAAPPALAAPTSGSLRIEPIAAYNFIVDSNVESPSTYAPEAGSLAAKICNDSATTTLTDLFIYIGDYNSATPSSSTPGIYPSKTQAPYVGTFSLTHEGGSAGTADATRYIPSLAPGQCTTQYWLVSYPRLDGAGNSVTGGIKPDDDLFLFYDMWATASEAGTPRAVDITRQVTMRNEISAAANKIWPNGTNKVPQQYLDAITAAGGWGTSVAGTPGAVAYPGQVASTQGIWYDLGNVGFGFDNDGDGVPDQNAWLQPIGDPNSYDPGCFRLVRSYGLLIVKLVGGGEQLIPFVDQLYFEGIPENTGVVGLVYYEYASLDGACTAGLSPYQEVASGYDNEKFSGDYGFGIPPLQSQEPAFTLNKSVNLTSIPASPTSTLQYTIAFANTSPVAVGNPSLGVPLVISEAIPAGTRYVAGSATTGNVTMPSGASIARVLFSTNGGTSWTATEPPAASVTNIQWWFGTPLQPAPNNTGNVRFSVTAPTDATTAVIPNTAGAGFGNNPPMITSTVTTLVQGPNSLSGNVFRDNGAGGLYANSIYDSASGETLLPNVAVTLFRDTNGNGVIDSGEPQIATTAATYTGAYSFGSLPDGNYIVQVDKLDADITTGWTNTTRTLRTAALDPTSLTTTAATATNLNFGFAPALTLSKQLLTPTSPVYENELVTFGINVRNTLPGSGTAGAACTYVIPATIVYPTDSAGMVPPGGGPTNAQWLNPNNALGLPDGNYTNSQMQNTADLIGLSGFNLGNQGGTIISVQHRVTVRERAEMRAGDYMRINVWYNNAVLSTGPQLFGNVAPFSGGLVGSVYTYNTDITGLRSWGWDDFAGNLTELQIEGTSSGGFPNGEIDLDSAAFVVTTNQTCGTDDTIISTVPITDTYDPARLQFISSIPPADVTTPAGSLAWNNEGPLYPGQQKTIQVTYRVLTPPSNGATTTNYAGTTSPRYANGRLANNAYANAPVTVNYDGSIAGRVFRDAVAGWAAGTGDTTGDTGLAGVTMELYACVNLSTGVLYTLPAPANDDCDGQVNGLSGWRLIASTTTAADGTYSFLGLRPGFYVVQVADGSPDAQLTGGVATSTLPAGFTASAEANDSQNTDAGFSCPSGTGCDGVWGLTSGTSARLDATDFEPINTVNEAINNVDFGYTLLNNGLYGLLWHDYDGDGVKDSNEPPLSGVTVYYCTSTPCAAGNASGTTTTNVNGGYSFGNVPNGTYYIGTNSTSGPLAAPTTWTNTYDTAVTGTTPLDSQSGAIAVSGGTYSGSHNFGYRQTGSLIIGDTVYYDWDADGTQDANEEGVRNVTVTLYRDVNGDGAIDATNDFLVGTTTTDQSGNYSFTNLPPGRYYVFVDRNDPDLPAAYPQTQDPDESGVCVSCNNRGLAVLTTANILTQDFGYRPNGVADIGDTVWFDRNGDGVQSGNQELGLAGITVQLQVDLNGDGTYVTVRSAVTDANGKYLFTDLPPLSYRVVVDPAQAPIPNDALGNNYSPTTPATVTVNLGTTDVLTADFGFAPLGAIGDTIFWDSNRNGGQDLAEPGINGVTVRLYRDVNNNNLYDAGTDTLVATAITATNPVSGKTGEYLFTGLTAGEYVVVVDGASTPINGRPQTSDPDRDGVPCASAVTGYTACNNQTPVTLYTGSTYMGADFGYQPVGVLGDTLWIDADNDGVRDANEAGLPYVTVSITGPGCAPCTTETDANGEYLFINLGDGSYTVTVNTADPDFTRFSSVGLVPSYDPDGTPNSSTTAVLAGGVVTQVGGVACPGAAGSCDLNADFGYRFFNAVGFDISGTLCLDNPAPGANGLCGPGTTGVDANESPFGGETVFLYRWSDLDADGNIDSGELVLAGVTTTNASGDYSFLDLPAATGNERYLVSIAAPTAGVSLTTATAGLPDAVSRSQNPAGYTESAYRAFNLAADRTNADFAFASTVSYDFGDLPTSYSTTLNGSPDGARHVLSPALYLGATPPDAESNGAPTATATGDGVDEDGVAVPQARWLNGPDGGSLNITVNGSGWLVGWIDFDRDGNFNDAADMVISQAVSTGTANYLIDVPASYFPGGSGPVLSLGARFRLFSAQPTIAALAYSGPAGAGEVEDYYLNFTPNPVTLTSFTATRVEPGVRLDWSTASEIDVAGYHLLRSATGQRADAQRITAELIPASGDSVIGSTYSYSDPAGTGAASYWLEVVHTDGALEEYGPVSAAPRPAARTVVYLPLVVR